MSSQNLDEPMTSLEYLENQLHSVSTKHTTAKDKALALCKKIEVSLLECTNTGAGAKHLQSALIVINAVQLKTRPTESSFPTKKRPAPNSNMEKQVHFKSTKKPWETKSQSLTKPTSDDVDK